MGQPVGLFAFRTLPSAAVELEREAATAVCADGWRLAVEIVRPLEPRAVAIAGHAMFVDRRTLDVMRDGLVSHLAARRIAVLWPDLRGHGKSGPLAADGGRWSYDDLVEQDTPALIGLARERLPGLPLVLVGHSLFGHVALAHVARHPEAAVEGLVLLAANIWARRWEGDALTMWKKRALMAAFDGVARAWGYFPARRLRLGNCDESTTYVSQLAGFARADDWVAGDGFSYAEALPGVRRPVLSIAAAGDRLLCIPESARRFLERVPGAVHRTVGRATGLPTDSSHMGLVLDRRCRPAWDEIADFVLRIN
jgi:predicted alpha/beta hydrolase